MKSKGNKALLIGSIISFVFAFLTFVAAIFFLGIFAAMYNDLTSKEAEDAGEAIALAFLVIFIAVYQVFGAIALIGTILLLATGIVSMIAYHKPNKALLIVTIATSTITTMIPSFVGAIVTLSNNKDKNI